MGGNEPAFCSFSRISITRPNSLFALVATEAEMILAHGQIGLVLRYVTIFIGKRLADVQSFQQRFDCVVALSRDRQRVALGIE